MCIVAFGVVTPGQLFGQGYANNWYFGNYHGLNFSSGTATYDSGNSKFMVEAAITMSDDQGNLLFYYSGDSVLNANHQKMFNSGNNVGGSLNITPSQYFATQQPDSAHKYFLFTTGSFGVLASQAELLYSVIDMSKQGGLGEVVTQDVSILGPGVTELVHGVKHANGNDIWVTAVKRAVGSSNVDTLCTFLLSATGIGPVSKYVPGYDLATSVSQTKFSPMGDRFVVGATGNSILLQFDNTNGTFSNPLAIDHGFANNGGREFSCDGSKLYTLMNGDLYQYDIAVHDSATIEGSAVQISTTPTFGILQLGPDHRIYGTTATSNYLFAIDEPNLPGLQCDYTDSAINLQSGVLINSMVYFEPSCLCQPVIYLDNLCFSDTTSFEFVASEPVDSVRWFFGDPSSSLGNTDTGLAATHVYSDTGTFVVRAIYYDSLLVDTVEKTVTILPLPAVDLGPDTALCAGDSVTLDVELSTMSYLWDDASTLPARTAAVPDTVWVTLSNVCGSASDTLVIDSVIVPVFDLGPDTILCPDDSILKSVSIPVGNLLWSTGDTLDSLWIDQQGTYSLTATHNCFLVSDTITVDSIQFPFVQLGNDTVLCEGDTIDIVTDTAQVDYLWQDGTIGPFYEVLQPDTYILAASNICGTAIDTIIIDSLIPALVHLPGDSILCVGDTVVLDATIQLGSYTWQDNSTNSSFNATQTGTYWAEAVNSCGISSDTIFLDFLDVPVFDLGNDTVLCVGDSIQLQASSHLSSYSWENASTDSLRWIYQDGTYSLTVSNQCFSAADTITIQGIDVPSFSLGPDTFLCEGYSQSLFASGDLATFLWHNGSTDSTILFSEGGQKWAEATNACGSFSDTVFIEDILFPMVSLPGDTALCENDSLLLNATFVGAWYLWNNASTDSVQLVQEEGFYKVEVTNECGTVTDSLTMTLEDSLLFSLGVDTLLCEGDSLSLSTFLSNDYPHFWQDTAGLSSFLVLVSGNYWVFVQNACGEAADTIVVAYTEEPTIELGPAQLLCAGDSAALVGTYPFSTYSWNTTDTTDTLWAFNSGTYNVTTTNQCGFDTDSVQVTFDDTLQVELGPTVWGCVGTSETLSAQLSGEAAYQWSTGFVTEQIKVDTEDDYWLDVTNICGTIRDSIRVNFREIPQVTVSADTQICAGDEIVISGTSNNDTLQWNTGVQGPELIVSTPGLYWLQSTNYCGSASDSVRVGGQARPQIVMPAQLQICPGEKRLLQPFPPTLDYHWQDGSNRPDFLVQREGQYEVIGYSDLGCADTASVLVRICPSLWVPSAFTPDGDGLNDVFKVEGESLNEFELQVFGRWGELLFSTRNPRQGWNGWYNGRLSAQGVYSWKVFFINRDGEEEIRAGSVTLIR